MSMKTTPKPPEGPTDWGVSKTKQSQEAQCNINNIIKMYTVTGTLTHISEALGEYRDMTLQPKDMHECMNIVANAQSLYHELPAEVRKATGHNVANFLPYIDDPENIDKCVEMGLLPAPNATRESKSVPTPPEAEKESPVQGGE